jgi:hypothetical protein
VERRVSRQGRATTTKYVKEGHMIRELIKKEKEKEKEREKEKRERKRKGWKRELHVWWQCMCKFFCM